MRPNAANNPPDRLSRSNVRRMILSPMYDCNARLSIHESIEDLFANRGDAGHAQCFVNNRCYDRDRLSPADQRVAKLVGVHSHKVRAIYNIYTHGSILNVQLNPHLCRPGDRSDRP